MKKLVVCLCAGALLTFSAGSAMAEDITGRIGVTGRIGILVPADSEAVAGGLISPIDTDLTFVGGGGFIFGIDKNLAAELDITHTEFDANNSAFNGSFATTNISLGGQYRFEITPRELTPYAGAGIDFLVNDFTGINGRRLDVDTVFGIHLSGGVDYFIRQDLALTAEFKVVIAPNADIKDPADGSKIGNYDPMNVNGTFGLRYFFN